MTSAMPATPTSPPLCWWCGAVADSREHKFKAAELRLNNGRGQWVGDAAVVHGDFSETTTDVRGAKSSILMWSPSMCQNCNGTRSQPYDLAYDQLLEYLDANEAAVGLSGRFRFSDVYGTDWLDRRTKLIKYWVKHVCCRAVEIGMEIPQELKDYLDSNAPGGAPPHIGFALSVQQNSLKLRLEDGFPHGSFMGDAMGYDDSDGDLVAIESHVTWSWFRLYYKLDLSDPIGRTAFECDVVQMEFEIVPWEDLDAIRGAEE